MRKIGKQVAVLFALTALSLMLQLGFASAIDLTVKETEISSLAIIELNKPAIFELQITNNEPDFDTFEIYSVVGRVDLKPEESFTIAGNSTKTISLEAYPRDTPGYFSFEYQIKNSVGQTKTENLAINIVNLKDAFNLYADNINPDSEKAIVHFDNKGGHSFGSIKADFSSVFFDDTKTFSLEPKEKKQFEIDINKEKAKELLAGPYILNANLELEGKSAVASSIVRFTEQSGLDTSDTSEGFFIRRHEITKTNRGNIPVDVETIIKRNVLLAIIITFNIAPTNEDTVSYDTFYIFEKTLAPGEELKVIEKTNWWIPFLIVVGICLIIYFLRKYLSERLKLIKKVTFVKTKGGEFALKISLVVKARDFVERIKVIDKIPGMVKLYERYGTITPDKVDHQNKRIEWDIENLNKEEERVFSYIIYSKMGIVGRFELPEAEALYEFKGKLIRATSNKSFFINESSLSKPHIQKMVDDLL